MKKQIELLMSFMLFSSLVLAQEAQDKKPHFVRVLAGASMPVGVYSKSEFEKAGGDYAQTGYALGIEGAWFFSKYVGLGLSVIRASHQVDDEEVEAVSLRFFGPFDFIYTPKSYQMTTFTTGLYFNIPLKSKFALQASTRGGLLLGKQPEVIYDGSLAFGEGSIGIGANKHSKTSFAYEVALGGTYQIKERWAASLQGILSGGRPEFEYVSSFLSAQAQNYKVNYLNLVLGLNYHF